MEVLKIFGRDCYAYCDEFVPVTTFIEEVGTRNKEYFFTKGTRRDKKKAHHDVMTHDNETLVINHTDLNDIILLCERFKKMNKDKENLASSIYDIKISSWTEVIDDKEIFRSFQFDQLSSHRYSLFIEGFEGDYSELKDILNTGGYSITFYFDTSSLF